MLICASSRVRCTVTATPPTATHTERRRQPGRPPAHARRGRERRQYRGSSARRAQPRGARRRPLRHSARSSLYQQKHREVRLQRPEAGARTVHLESGTGNASGPHRKIHGDPCPDRLSTLPVARTVLFRSPMEIEGEGADRRSDVVAVDDESVLFAITGIPDAAGPRGASRLRRPDRQAPRGAPLYGVVTVFHLTPARGADGFRRSRGGTRDTGAARVVLLTARGSPGGRTGRGRVRRPSRDREASSAGGPRARVLLEPGRRRHERRGDRAGRARRVRRRAGDHVRADADALPGRRCSSVSVRSRRIAGGDAARCSRDGRTRSRAKGAAQASDRCSRPRAAGRPPGAPPAARDEPSSRFRSPAPGSARSGAARDGCARAAAPGCRHRSSGAVGVPAFFGRRRVDRRRHRTPLGSMSLENARPCPRYSASITSRQTSPRPCRTSSTRR